MRGTRGWRRSWWTPSCGAKWTSRCASRRRPRLGVTEPVVVVAGTARAAAIRRPSSTASTAPRAARLDVLSGVQGERLVTIVGGSADPLDAARAPRRAVGPGAVVVGPPVPDLLAASRSARDALAGQRAAAAWPEAPRPVLADDLLAERAVDGDARRSAGW